MGFIATDDRRLEQFLFVHDIRFHHQTKDECGRTSWHYLDSPETRRVNQEYRMICQRRIARKEESHE